ncbi:MAG: hypothetical protein IT378_11810 [Sandaracinaceae bacterium]|nr:hypothetical protein [Sandaracinaceae bacterium]
MLVDAVKLRWHLDLAAHPSTHAWVLNLYRAGEKHPETVTDYFPWRHAEDRWPELARALKRHAGDERKHAVLYARAIEAMGEEVVELEGLDVFNHAIRAETPSSWAIADGDPPERKRLQIANFLAHAGCLERRIARSVAYHLEACEKLGRHDVTGTVERVHADEERHVAYTSEALVELTTASERARITALHVEAEARADRAFSARQVRTFLRRFGPSVPLSRRALYAACALAMESRS